MFYFFIKRLFDILVGFIGTLILIPFSLVIKFIYIITGDFHSIFFTQKRVGKNGKYFLIFKYRTMFVNADLMLDDLLKDKDIYYEYINSYKIKEDKRVTKVGKILRKLSIDEMPQFLNLIIGNMSLIGPRPILSSELLLYKDQKNKFLSVKPGIIGNWVCNGRSNISYDDRIKLELFYVDNMSFLLDVKIFFKSILAIIKRIGAF